MKHKLIKDGGIKVDKAYFFGNKKYGYTFKNNEHKIIEK